MSQKLKTPRKPKIRILAAVPAIHTDHVVYLEQVKEAIQANMAANPDFEVEFVVDESPDNKVREEDSWSSVVDKFNVLSERVVQEKFDYLWIIEADVIIPEHALNHLYNCNVDVAAAVVPYKFQNIEYWNKQGWQLKPGDLIPFKIFEGMACTGYFQPDSEGKPTYETKTLYLHHLKDKILQGNPQHMIFNGTGCILIKRKIFESGIRWHYEKRVIRVSGFDVYFWQDIQKAGFSAVTDGFVICQHLGA